MQVEDFDACCCEGLDWRKGKNDQNQGMTVLDILILIKSFPADKKKWFNTVSLSLLCSTSVQESVRKALFIYFI